MENLPFFRTYIILSSLESQKMDFNQKLLLKSILEYLLKSPDGTGDIGTLLSLHFGETALLDEEHHLFKLPLSMEVEFENKQNFLAFLKNVEQRISFLLPVVYKVEGVDYDIVQYKFKQTVKIGLIAYFYNPPEIKGVNPQIGVTSDLEARANVESGADNLTGGSAIQPEKTTEPAQISGSATTSPTTTK